MVNKSELFKKIGGILTEINEQYEYISNHPNTLNELELELLSANTNFLIQNVQILIRTCALESGKEVTAKEETISTPALPIAHIPAEVKLEPAVPSIAEVVVPAAEPAIPALEAIIEEKAPATILPEISVPIVATPVSEPPVVIPVVELPKVEAPTIAEPPVYQAPVSPAHQAPIVPKYNEANQIEEVTAKEEAKPMTLNELISAQKAQAANTSSTPRMPSAQHKELKTMVSLNDKLLFIKELFNGYSLAYSEAIEILNRQDSFQSAKAFLEQNYVQKNHWTEKAETTEKFYEILERRFS